MTIEEIQVSIQQEFALLQGNREDILHYIIELGEQMPPMDKKHKTKLNLVTGCMSQVWIIYRKENNLLFFEGDSNTSITRGLISLLLRVLSGQNIDDIIHANLSFVRDIHLTQLIGSQRAGGFANMVKTIKLIALKQK